MRHPLGEGPVCFTPGQDVTHGHKVAGGLVSSAEGFPKVIGTKGRGAWTGGMFEAADGTSHIARTELRDSAGARGFQGCDVGQSALRVICLKAGKGSGILG